ncbi:MAG: VCBS repeat-containing protein [Candidatus Thermoplasmatota archaeon]|nr:VCBS repeat-containing protein [Candidatus Thermoplasmatota archaeon]
MTRLVSSVLAIAMIALLLSPIGYQGDPGIGLPEAVIVTGSAPAPSPEELVFPEPIDTSNPVPEYTLVSRALMLPGGASDVVVDDLNDDGRTDLIVSVYDALRISIFYREVDGTFKTYPSLNITTMYHPASIRTADIYASGHHQIVVLEKNPAYSDTRLAIYNLTSETTYERWPDRFTLTNGIEFVVGEFSGDIYADLAVVCEGSSPQTTAGKVEVFFGPNFSDIEILTAGRGARSIEAADLNNDSLLEIAVGNYYDSNVMVFERPFLSGTPPLVTLSVEGAPTAVVAGQLDGDSHSLTDLAVASASPDAIRFYAQSMGSLPPFEDMNITVPYTPSSIHVGDMNSDGRQDLLVLSQTGNTTFGYHQGSSAPIWQAVPEFIFPTGGVPRAAVIAELDGDGFVDISVAASGADWKGAALPIYPFRSPSFSNSNSTTWTRVDAVTSMLETGDFDGDDVIDLMLLNTDDDSIDFYPSFGSALTTIPLGFSPGKMAVADFNRDSLSDVAVAEFQGATVAIIFGCSTFPDQSVLLTVNGSVTDIEIGDFNDDSYADFVVSTGEGGLSFYFNDHSAAAFGSAYEISPSGGAGIWSIASGDFNSDGMDDIAYTRPIRKIAVLLQDSAIPFGPSSPTLTLSHSEGTDFTSVWCGDLTGDGLDDIAAMRSFDSAVYLFDQDEFQTAPHPYGVLSLPSFPSFLSVFDATDDGPADVVAIFDDAALLFLYRQASGAFPSSPSMAFVTGAGPVYACIGDGTQDHRGDMLVVNQGSHCVSIWQQVNFPPVAHSGGPYVTREGANLRFNGSATTGTSEIPFMDYQWDFGDGNVTGWIRNPTPGHEYEAIGNYSISLQVRDPAGLYSSDSSYVVVLDSYPVVDFTWSPEFVDEGQTVTFTDMTWSYDAVSYRAWFIDGQHAGEGSVLSTEFQDGNHSISLYVVDFDGSEVNLTKILAVNSTAPVLRILAPSEGIEGESIEFAVVVDEWHGEPVDPITTYEWDFSYVTDEFNRDPYVPNTDNVTHVFSSSSWWNIYRVAARVTDSDGMQNLTTWDIRIYDVAPSAQLGLNTSDPREGIPFTFLSSSYSHDGIVNWTWRLAHPNGSSEYLYIDERDMASLEFDYLNDGGYTMYLTVREADGNTSSAQLSFHVSEIPPLVDLVTLYSGGEDGFFEEFTPVEFLADAAGLDEIAFYEWDFDARGGEFISDGPSSPANTSNHTYTQIGNYTAKVRVTDVDGSSAIAWVYVEVRQKPLTGNLYSDIAIRRGWDSREFTFYAETLALEFPDIVHVVWEFGDGVIESRDGPPVDPVFHFYESGRDYLVNVTVIDDDGYSKVISGMVFVTPPVIRLVSPENDSVVRSGTVIRFEIVPGTRPINLVYFDINNQGYELFQVQYVIDTTGWDSVTYVITVMVWDWGGNTIFLRNVNITIDDVFPVSQISANKNRIYGGEDFRINVWVNDFNVRASGVVLNVKFPDDRQFLRYPVVEDEYEPGRFYAVFKAPSTRGTVQFFANVTDLAGNMYQSEVYSLDMSLRFMTVAWPYLLLMMAAITVSVSAYFMREERIAVDEAFVIFRDGRLITHSTRRLKPGMDDHVLGSMLVAIQDFVKDSFKDVTSFALRRLDFGEKSVLVERGNNVYLAVVLHGQASKKVAVKMKQVVEEIESSFSKALKDWDGDLDKVRGISDITKGLYSRMPMFRGQTRRGS